MKMPENHDEGTEESLQAPLRLVSELAQIPRKEIFVPRTIDETILREARRCLEKPARRGFSWRLWIPRFATAAVVLALVALVAFKFGMPSRPPVFAREDLNHDGRVDILDAFALARQLKSGQAASQTQDINGDGVVDRRDVETIATHAVQLEKGGHS